MLREKVIQLGLDGVITPDEMVYLLKLLKADSIFENDKGKIKTTDDTIQEFKDYPPYLDCPKPRK